MFCVCLCRRNLNYFSSAYTAAVSAVDPDAGHGELVIKVPSELWKQGDGNFIFFFFESPPTIIEAVILLVFCYFLLIARFRGWGTTNLLSVQSNISSF